MLDWLAINCIAGEHQAGQSCSGRDGHPCAVPAGPLTAIGQHERLVGVPQGCVEGSGARGKPCGSAGPVAPPLLSAGHCSRLQTPGEASTAVGGCCAAAGASSWGAHTGRHWPPAPAPRRPPTRPVPTRLCPPVAGHAQAYQRQQPGDRPPVVPADRQWCRQTGRRRPGCRQRWRWQRWLCRAPLLSCTNAWHSGF